MVSTLTTNLTFGSFLAQHADDGSYELVNGEIIKMPDPTRAHKNIARFLAKIFDQEVDRLNLDYVVEREIAVRTFLENGREQGRRPDVGVISKTLWDSSPHSYGAVMAMQLAVEVVSTNWEDDYVDKLAEYQGIGIPEYWIVDYLAIASRSYLGEPKQPSIFVYQLINGVYQSRLFQGEEVIVSSTFPELQLTVAKVLKQSLGEN